MKRIGAPLLAMVFVVSMVRLRAKAAVTANDAEEITFTNNSFGEVELTLDPKGCANYSWIESSEFKTSELLNCSLQFGISLSNGKNVVISADPMQYLNMMLKSESVSGADKFAIAAYVKYAEAAYAYYLATL